MDFDPSLLADLRVLAETVDLECKLAQGEHGRGALPKDFWPTYSAMANAQGGVVLLGIGEQAGRFAVKGIAEPERVRQELFNSLNNRQKVSVNLLSERHVTSHQVDGHVVMAVRIPPATRHQRPVYLNGQPLGNTFRRLHDGDRQCDDETVKRMLAEQVEDERDRRILSHFDLSDIEPESLRVYRQMLRDEKPSHPYLELPDGDFLRSVGGWRRDRESGDEGLTLAGLLMFGRWEAIQEGVPHYFVDYQERPEARVERRWVDRLVPDGNWSGNVFDFYRRVYRKLVADLKVPFAVQDGQRQDDSPVHQALREALVNTLVHADYTGRVSVLVVKRPDMFGFRNPGRLRLPLPQVLAGGESDCRNRLMHQMFLMIGLGERAGSGMPKILSGWQSQHWRQPLLKEKDEPEQTLLELHMLDLLPEGVVRMLRERIGRAFDDLDRGERLILATAAIEQSVNHARLAGISDLHPHDLSTKLARLEREGWLHATGQTRGKVYFLSGARPLAPEDVFSEGSVPEPAPDFNRPMSGLHDGKSGHYDGKSGHYDGKSGHGCDMLAPKHGPSGAEAASNRDPHGCLLTSKLDAPVIDSLDLLSPQLREELVAKATLPRLKSRLEPDVMTDVILAICTGRYLRLHAMAELLQRNPEALRKSHLDRLVKQGLLLRAFPSTPNHVKQSYRATPPSEQPV